MEAVPLAVMRSEAKHLLLFGHRGDKKGGKEEAVHSREERTMYRKLRIAVLSLVVFSVAVWAADDPLIGTWKLNLAKSKFSGSSPSRSDTMKYEPYGAGGIKVTRTILTAKGETHHEDYN